jgi:hypothetical protein
MNSLSLSIQQYRQSVAALIAVVLCMLIAGCLWSTWYMYKPMRVQMLWKDGCIEVDMEGIGTSRELAENDAKRKAAEKAKGTFIQGNISLSSENTTTVTSDKTDFIDRQTMQEKVQSRIEADCRSVDYLKYWKDQDGEYHVKIRTIVKIQEKR